MRKNRQRRLSTSALVALVCAVLSVAVAAVMAFVVLRKGTATVFASASPFEKAEEHASVPAETVGETLRDTPTMPDAPTSPTVRPSSGTPREESQRVESMSELQVGQWVYTDIGSVCPIYLQDTDGRVTDVVCKSITRWSGEIYIYMTAEQYRTYFNANEYFESQNYNALVFKEPVQIGGTVIYADNVDDYLSFYIDSDSVIKLQEVN